MILIIIHEYYLGSMHAINSFSLHLQFFVEGVPPEAVDASCGVGYAESRFVLIWNDLEMVKSYLAE